MSVGCLLNVTLQKKMHRSKTLISFPVNHNTLALKTSVLIFPFVFRAQDASILRGQHRPPLMDTDGRKRSSKVGLPRDANVGLLEKQRTFEDKDYQARKVQTNQKEPFAM